MTALELQTKFKESFAKYFPNGKLVSKRMTLGEGIFFHGYLIGNNDDHISQIALNDPLTIMIAIYDIIEYDNNEIDLSSTELLLEFEQSSLKVLPTIKHMAMESVKIRTRKVKGTPQRLVLAIDKYFKNVYDIVQSNAALNNIYNQNNIDVKYLQSI